MDAHVWGLQGLVFELARMRGIGPFRLEYRNRGDDVVIGLVLERTAVAADANIDTTALSRDGAERRACKAS